MKPSSFKGFYSQTFMDLDVDQLAVILDNYL